MFSFQHSESGLSSTLTRESPLRRSFHDQARSRIFSESSTDFTDSIFSCMSMNDLSVRPTWKMYYLSNETLIDKLLKVVFISFIFWQISAREKLAVCDVTNLPYMDINRQSISIYGYLVTSLTVYYSCADININ